MQKSNQNWLVLSPKHFLLEAIKEFMLQNLTSTHEQKMQRLEAMCEKYGIDFNEHYGK